MRAVLDEEIKQEALNIQFVALKIDGAGRAHSISQPLQIDNEDRIGNWPEGFLDDDLKESRRLLNVMYGIIPDQAKEGADGSDV